MDGQDVADTIRIERLHYQFIDKPLIVGGLAMEYYGLRKHGDDVDFIITDRDYQNLKRKYPKNRKDVWGDFGLAIQDFELFRSMYKFDYSYYTQGSIALGDFLIVGIDMLFRMKIYAMYAGEKHREDVDRLRGFFDKNQNQKYASYMERHITRYTTSDTGIFEHVEYSDED